MRQAVLLLAHGAPERVEDVKEYLGYVRGGRPADPAVTAEVAHRYEAIGGSSPLRHWTQVQAEALAARLDVPVYFGMRNWRPFLSEAVGRMRDDGVERVVAICLAPQYARMSVGFYFRRVQEAKVASGFAGEIVWTKSFHDHPLLIGAFAERLSPVAPGKKVLFTAHSLPSQALDRGDPYDAECRATARLVAERLALPDWEFAYQSQGMTGGEWLGPTVESRLDSYSPGEVVLAPIGFVCDHVEVLYDVDIHFRGYAAARGIQLSRPESLNGSATFTSALAAVASEKLKRE